MGLTFDHKEFEEIVNDSNNEEIKNLLVEHIREMRMSSQEKAIVGAVNENSQRITNLANAIARIKFEADHSGVIAALDKIFDKVNDSLDEVKQSNEILLGAVNELIKVNSADRIFKPTYGVLHKLESIIVSIKK